ncbi:MAG: sigma-70 family RNA polymerase sigma factor [Clostridiaceae bacterium]|nr:sigma-70 family RNA polymerase sigma factor [Clostridiaceae bacterium]
MKATDEQFRQIVLRYEKLVFTICRQLVQDYQEAQNLTQDTFLAAYLHLDSCCEADLKPWLARIAANKAKDYLKSAYQQRVQLSEEDFAWIPDQTPAPDEICQSDEEVRQIKEKIYALKEPYQRVAAMHFIDEKSVEEIAYTLKRPKKTIQTQLLRSRHRLQRLLEEDT